MENKIKKSIILYQVIMALVGIFLLVGTIMVGFFLAASIVGLVFNTIILKSCYEYYKEDKKKLFIICQYLQIFGVSFFGFYFYLRSSVYAGYTFAYEDSKLLFDFSISLPEYALIFKEDINSLGVSFNLLPIIIIGLIKGKK